MDKELREKEWYKYITEEEERYDFHIEVKNLTGRRITIYTKYSDEI